MQKIILYFALVLFCFSAPKEETLLQATQAGWFLGAGLGAGFEKFQMEGSNIQQSTKNYGTFLASAKIGRFHYFTQRIGLRYYYNLDFGFNPGDPRTSPLAEDVGFFLITQSHTLNTDMIFNAYSQGKHRLSIIGGLGLGLAIQNYDQRFETRHGFAGLEDRFTLGFQGRINLGMQWKFEEKYGLELMAKIPFTPAMVTDDRTTSGGSTTEHKVTIRPYYFTLDFVMEL